MANAAQLEILKQGVEVWNQWRIDHIDEKIDLYGADLRKADLPRADLSNADLTRANLSGADLSRVNLIGADLRDADLFEADLREADLSRADLREAYLNGADLRGADLRGAHLSGADLREADLRDADLRDADLIRVDLRDTDLSEADLTGAHLGGANLSGAHLSGAHLNGADLRRADLRRADLTEANLNGTRLIQANLGEAILTGAKLYGTARDDWTIERVTCEYVVWAEAHDFSDKEEQKKWETEHRTPKDRDFRPGEFEELYKQLPTFEYIFEHGFTALDAVVINRIVEAINDQHPEFELTLDSFHSRGQPHAKFTVLHKEDIEAAKNQVTTDYESRIAALEGKQEQMLALMSKLVSEKYHITAGGDVIIAGQDIVGGNKDQRAITAGRDYLERVEGQAQVTTGNSGQANEVTDMNQLTTKEALQEHYHLLSEKINALRKDQILATDTEVKFKLKHQIQEAETMLEQIEQRLTEFEGNQTPQEKF